VVPQNFSHVDPNIWHSVVDKREEVQFEIFFEKIFRVHHFIAAHKNVQLSFFESFSLEVSISYHPHYARLLGLILVELLQDVGQSVARRLPHLGHVV